MKTVIASGHAPVDFLVRVDELTYQSIEGAKGAMELISADQFLKLKGQYAAHWKLCSGGSALNVLKVLSRGGFACRFIGCVGRDEEADFLRQDYSRYGIEADLEEHSLQTTRILCFISPEGRRTFRTCLGASEQLSSEWVYKVDWSRIECLHVEGYQFLHGELAFESLEAAKRHGVKVSLDLGSYTIVQKERDKILHYLKHRVDFLFGNHREMEALFGVGILKEVSPLLEYASVGVVTLGPKGAICVSAKQCVLLEAPQVPVLDTTGAGDFFAGGFLQSYLKGGSLERSLQSATHYSSRVIGQIGTDIIACS